MKRKLRANPIVRAATVMLTTLQIINIVSLPYIIKKWK